MTCFGSHFGPFGALRLARGDTGPLGRHGRHALGRHAPGRHGRHGPHARSLCHPFGFPASPSSRAWIGADCRGHRLTAVRVPQRVARRCRHRWRCRGPAVPRTPGAGFCDPSAYAHEPPELAHEVHCTSICAIHSIFSSARQLGIVSTKKLFERSRRTMSGSRGPLGAPCRGNCAKHAGTRRHRARRAASTGLSALRAMQRSAAQRNAIN